MHIVIVGSLNMDLVVRIPRIPKPGETLTGGTFATFPGGKGANQAVAAARLGAQVTMIGQVGGDAFGSELISGLQKEGIETRYIGVDEHTATGVALIEVDEHGQNSIAVAPGANFTLTEAKVRQILSEIDAFDCLSMPLETPLETVYAATQIAKKRRSRVILNPAPAQILKRDLLEQIDVLIPNEHEAATMTGITPDMEDSCRAAAAALLKEGVGSVILTLGDQGACVMEKSSGKEQALKFVPAYAVQAVDTTAAGDCFVGAIAVGLAEGKSLVEAAHFASAAAAISVTRYGAQPSMPTREETDRFILERKKIV